ncbi:MAG TPA: response regulator transcription factor [Nitrospirota bacterium]|nr:response regulator transcription factor [Nitrospirota bacterium]
MQIVLVDGRPVVRKGLKALLQEESDFNITGEAEDGASALNIINKLKPDIVILGLKLSGMNGLQVLSMLKEICPSIRIVILSLLANSYCVDEAFRKGAQGYVVMDAMEHEIIEAVRTVAAGGEYVCDMLALAHSSSRKGRPAGMRHDRYHSLTRRECEIITLIAQGHFNKDVASQLNISIRTVETHRANIMRKLNLRSPSALIHYAVSRNMLEIT